MHRASKFGCPLSPYPRVDKFGCALSPHPRVELLEQITQCIVIIREHGIILTSCLSCIACCLWQMKPFKEPGRCLSAQNWLKFSTTNAFSIKEASSISLVFSDDLDVLQPPRFTHENHVFLDFLPSGCKLPETTT